MINIEKMAQHHFANTQEIPSAGIILSPEVRKMCALNTCGHFGKNWTCPPAVEPLDAIRDKIASFDTFVVVYQVYSVKSSFDWKGMMAGATDFKDKLQALKNELEAADPDFKFMILGVGGCHLCDPCAYIDGEPCRDPEAAIVSLEASGIDVMRLMKDHGLKYYNGKNTVTYIGGMLYHKVSMVS